VNGDTEISGDLTVSGTITGGTVSGTITNADNVKIDDAPNDTTNYLVFTRDSTAGHKRLYEETSLCLRWDSTNNRLYVLGDIRVSSGLLHDGDTNTQFWFPEDDTAAIRTNSEDRVYVNSSGDVGINTDSPLGKLHVNGGTGDCRLVVQADTNNSGEGDNPTVLFVQDGTYRTGEVGTDSNNGLVYRSYGDQIWYSSSVHSNTSNTALKDNQTERMRIRSDNGYVGIGVASPDATLDVNGYVNCVGFICNDYVGYFHKGLRINGAEATVDYNNTNTAYGAPGIDVDPNNLAFSLYTQYSVRSANFVAYSDSRIKSNVVDISDTTALDQLRQLQPKYYEYVDKVARGSSSVIGFIAQEVKEVVPQAVSVADGDIPNIYQTANVSANTLTFTNFYTSNLDATSNTLVVYEEGTKRKDLTILEVVDEHTIRVDTDIAGEDVFVYGQVVQDFHHLNKDYLWTIATSALQEVDRQLQAEKARNDSLEARIQALETALGISI
jgi:hypothetical protein